MTQVPAESVHFTVEQIREGFELVTIENTDDGPLTIDSVGIWFPALSMGYDFGPSRLSKNHPFPGYPVMIAQVRRSPTRSMSGRSPMRSWRSRT